MIIDRVACTASQVELSGFDSIRVKVTSKCPWSCRFCHKEGSPLSQDLALDERLVRLFCQFHELGFREVHLTGGEPMWFPDCANLVHELHRIGFRIKLTSNGQFRPRLLRELASSGLYGVNFSIHTLDPKRLAEIQEPPESVEWGENAIEAQMRNLRAAQTLGLVTKVNAVVQETVEDAIEVIRFCQQEGIDLRLLNDLGLGAVSIETLIELLQELGAEVETVAIVDGVSSYSCGVVTRSGFRFSVKTIRHASLGTMCSTCDRREDCQEWFYGIRVEQMGTEVMVRLCLHRDDPPFVQSAEDFLESEQLAEIRHLM